MNAKTQMHKDGVDSYQPVSQLLLKRFIDQ